MSRTAPENLALWVTKQAAARELNLSEKSIDRMAERGQIQKRKRKQRGSPDLAVFHPADIARLKAAREELPPAPFPVPATNGHAAMVPVPRQPEAVALVQALTAIAERVAPPVELKEPHFVTLKMAREISGLPASFLRQQFVETGRAVKTGSGWRIARAELERFARETMRTGLDMSRTEGSHE